MDLDPSLPTNILKAFAKPFGVCDHHVNVPVVVANGWIVVVIVMSLVNAVCIIVGLKSV